MNKFFSKTCLHEDRGYKKICKLLLSSCIISSSKLAQNNLKVIKIYLCKKKKKKFIEIQNP